MTFTNEDIDADEDRAPPASSTVFHITRVIIVDRRALIRECIASSLRTLGPRIDILRGASVAENLRADELASATMVVLSTSMAPAFNKALHRDVTWLHLHSRDVPIVLLADTCDAEEARYLLTHLHLQGIIPTTSTLATAKAALETVMSGGTYLPPSGVEDTEEAPDASGAPNGTHVVKLTARERAVLFFLREGMPNKIIAHRLGISQSTVKAHIHSIMTKLHSRNRTEAALAMTIPLFGQIRGDEMDPLFTNRRVREQS